MEKLQFTIDINAPAARVYNQMLGIDNRASYEQWTALFHPTSTYEGSWVKGAKMYFIGTGEDGKRGGMVSEIRENVPDRFVSIRHYGMLDGDNEITEGPEVEKWAGGLENYTFDENNGVTTLTIHTDTTDEYMGYFNETWPKALEELKRICEA